jgi:phosphatidylethanolamine-binding protein (PEBP) family uncharacterized protein
MALRISSPAFSSGADIPKKYTCNGQDLALPLEWSGVPKQSKSLAVICDDPDAPSGTFTHWVLDDTPASAQRLAEGASIGTAGVNSFGSRDSEVRVHQRRITLTTTISTCTRLMSIRSDRLDSPKKTR